jgi:hypothetical protein
MSTQTYSPNWAPHVVGEYESAIDPETGRPEPTWVRMQCRTCGARHQVKCTSGSYRTWITKFATVHVHRDPLAPKEKKR